MCGYRVDGEIGRFEFDTHQVLNGKSIIFNTSREFFPQLRPKERYLTSGFKQIAMILGDTEKSYRKTTRTINHVRRQNKEGTPFRTLRENTEKEGSQVIEYIEKKTENVLRRNQFSRDGTYKGDPEKYESINPAVIQSQTVEEVAEKLDCAYGVQDLLNNPVCFEEPSKTVNIAIDDVSVKKQSETREKKTKHTGEKRKRKFVHNTVVKIENDYKQYSLVGSGIKVTLLYLIAFLISNKLTGYRFQFFTDGHTILNDTIWGCFKWYPNLGIILDWFHLVKKCKELLSMALKGRHIRNEILREIMPFLWHGLTDQAIGALEQIDPGKLKNEEKLSKLIEYLKRNKNMIPCYALRKDLGLRNSSAIGEKMNDLIVSSRQKHNGMSWSKIGSLALAAITTLSLNNETDTWLEKGKLNFCLTS